MGGEVIDPSNDSGRRRGSGWEPLALGVTAVFLGLVAVVASAINSHSHRSNVIPGPLWQSLTACAVLAGLGAAISWAISSARWRPGPLVGALIGVMAMIVVPVEAIAVRPHSVRATLIAVDSRTGKKLWTIRPSLLRVTGELGSDVNGQVVAGGPEGRCADRQAEVHLDPRTGHQIGETVHTAQGPFSALLAEVADEQTTFSAEGGPTGSTTLKAVDKSGAVRWTVPLVAGPPPVIAAGSGIVIVNSPNFGPPTGFPVPAGAPAGGPPVGVRVIDAASGHELWHDESSGAGTGATVAGGQVWLLSGDGTLSRRNPRTGQVLSQVAIGFRPATLVGAGKLGPGLWSAAGVLVSVNAADHLVGFDEAGRPKWEITLPGSSPQIAVAASGSTVVVGVDGHESSGCGGGN